MLIVSLEIVRYHYILLLLFRCVIIMLNMFGTLSNSYLYLIFLNNLIVLLLLSTYERYLEAI